MKRSTAIAPPKHLQPETKKWFSSVLEEYELEPHHIVLLTLAAESWDRASQARLTIAEHGICFTDRFGAPRKHPAVSVEEAARMHGGAVRQAFEEGVARMEQALAASRRIAWLSLAASVVALTAAVCAIFVHMIH